MSTQVPLSPALLIAAANSFLGVRAADALAPPDLAFVHHVGYWSHYDQRCARSSWPLPETASVEELVQYGETSGAVREAPLTGDLMLLWSPERRQLMRIGIIAHVDRLGHFPSGEEFYACITIEGASDGNADAPGTIGVRCVREVSPARGDKFLRWTALDGREERREMIERELDERARVLAA